MRFLRGFLRWFERVILPARLRPSVLQYRLQSSVERAASEVERGALPGEKAAAKVKPLEEPQPGTFWVILRWTLHFLLLAAIRVGLWYLNGWLQLDKVLRSPFPVLHAYWLPIL